MPIEKNGEDVSTLGPLRSQWMEVTPKLAKRWLENNFKNRPLVKDVVNAYARDMIGGRWVYTHQGIAFNDQDELIDGQHRLHAVIIANMAVRMMVTFGLPSKIDGHEMTTMDAVDRGRTRSVADQLTIQHGMRNGSITASICAAIASICYGERTRRLSVGQTLDVFRAYEDAITWVIAHKSRETGLRSTGVLAGFAFAMATEGGCGHQSTPVSLMFEALVSGEGINAKSGMASLRAFLTSDEAKLITRSLDRGLAGHVVSMTSAPSLRRGSKWTSVATCQCGWRSAVPCERHVAQDRAIERHWEAVIAGSVEQEQEGSLRSR